MKKVSILIALVGMTNGTQLKELSDVVTNADWVELPDCGSKGADNSVPLADDVSNATSATCKSKFVPGSYDPNDQANKTHTLHPNPNQIYYPLYTSIPIRENPGLFILSPKKRDYSTGTINSTLHQKEIQAC